jgi:hypothetical protein
MPKNILFFIAITANFLSATPTKESINSDIDILAAKLEILGDRNKADVEEFKSIATRLRRNLLELSNKDKVLDQAIDQFLAYAMNFDESDRSILGFKATTEFDKARVLAPLQSEKYILPSRQLAKRATLKFYNNVLLPFLGLIADIKKTLSKQK